jgi:hypothetical protein
MATHDEARQAIIDAIAKMAPKAATVKGVLTLAEAYAWVTVPGQAHGAQVEVKS